MTKNSNWIEPEPVTKSKPMTLAEAKQKLMKLADGKYHTISYSVTDYGNGKHEQKCEVYVTGHDHHDAKTWESAFFALENQMNQVDQPKISEQMPLSLKGAEDDI